MQKINNGTWPDPNFIPFNGQKILGLDALKIRPLQQAAVPLTGGWKRWLVRCRLENPTTFCPSCGGRGSVRSSKWRHFVHIPVGLDQVHLLVRVHRYVCPDCCCSWRDDLSTLAPARRRITRPALLWALLQMCDKGVSIAGLARSLGTSWGALNAAVLGKAEGILAVDDPHRLDGMTAIGVDEHVWRHTPLGDRYVTVIVDITNHTQGKTARLLDVIPGRSARVVGTWLRKQGTAFQRRVRVVTMDAFEGFKKAAQNNLPHATEIVDPFHVVHLAAAKLDAVRCDLQIKQTGHRGRRGDPLFSCRLALHKSDEFKTERQQEKVRNLFQNPANKPLWLAHSIYQRIISCYRQRDRRTGRQMMEDLITALNIPGALKEIPQFRALAHTLGRREHDILAYFTYHQSNGPIEAINGRLESLRRIALGFRNILNYRLRCLIHSGTLKDTLALP